ncbi:DUF1093 domain-containing protein [Vagococcus hydrophili]|uniref:YxeA family protein n=1 Tax=Vagococcus hydrophili TaxID=2714947 RepID=A0A6G8ASV4_9ENTE|nr:DUF1093 domain-containing protein [Vagococcus hydrophili]QIL48158.1 YxeA family protein [Vagococcus hydrophili]
MKKIIPIILLIVAGFIGYKGYTYYNDTYKATTAYALVPEVPEKKEARDDSNRPIKDEDGSINYTYDYSFNFIKKDGTKQTQDFGLTGSNAEPYEPGTYVTAEISNKRVVKGPYTVKEDQIPKEILAQLKGK